MPILAADEAVRVGMLGAGGHRSIWQVSPRSQGMHRDSSGDLADAGFRKRRSEAKGFGGRDVCIG